MQVTKLTLLPSVGDHEVDSVWRKLYLVLAKMLHNPDTKMTVQSNHVEFELNGFIIDMWAHCMIVKVEGGPRQRLPNPEHAAAVQAPRPLGQRGGVDQ